MTNPVIFGHLKIPRGNLRAQTRPGTGPSSLPTAATGRQTGRAHAAVSRDSGWWDGTLGRTVRSYDETITE
jgi:hypothetical protein